MNAIINARIYDFHNYQEHKCIVFDETIQAILDMSEYKPDDYEQIIDAKNQIVMPGLISGHTHLYSAFARGMSVPFNPHNFKEILEQMWWKLDHFLTLDDIYYSAYASGLEQLMAGSTTLIDHHASYHIRGSLNTLKKALIKDLGMRAVLAFETSDRFNVDEAIKENADFIRENHSSVCRGLFGLHASFTLSDDTLAKVKQKLFGAGIHIHVAESIMDETLTKEKHGKSVVKRLDDFGLINDRSILVHCANASDEELDIINARNAKIAINVSSNMNNAVGLPDIAKIRAKGIDYFIGNDGLISSMPIEYINAYYTAHLKTKNPVGLSLDAIKDAINNLYHYTSELFGVKLGRIEPGYVADLITVPYHEFTPLNQDNAFGHVFFGLFPNLKPETVICQGKVLIQEHQMNETMKQTYAFAKQVANKLWDRLEKEGPNLEFAE